MLGDLVFHAKKPRFNYTHHYIQTVSIHQTLKYIRPYQTKLLIYTEGPLSYLTSSYTILSLAVVPSGMMCTFEYTFKKIGLRPLSKILQLLFTFLKLHLTIIILYLFLFICSNGCCPAQQLQFEKILKDGTASCLLIFNLLHKISLIYYWT